MAQSSLSGGDTNSNIPSTHLAGTTHSVSQWLVLSTVVTRRDNVVVVGGDVVVTTVAENV